MITLTKLDSSLHFPDVEQALDDPNGLLAFAGDLSVERLVKAYSKGIFPWYSHGEPIMWWSPEPRGVMPLKAFSPSKSLQKFARRCGLKVTVNHAFSQVIEACAHIPRNDSGTWITPEMIQAYKNLHAAGHSHSIEIWEDSSNERPNDRKLVGGLYGVVSGKLFCGESMFHHVTNCSKLAFWYLIEYLKTEDAEWIDCQMQNPHLASLGCVEISRATFVQTLAEQTSLSFSKNFWLPKDITDTVKI